MQDKKAFTLAEILITLAVVGILAAFTIPTLYTKSTEDEYKTKLRKVVSSLSGAANVNYAQTGIDFARIESGNTNDDAGAPSFVSILKNRMAVVTTSRADMEWDSSISSSINLCYTLADNSVIGFSSSIGSCTSIGSCMIYVDVNGIRPPNKLSTATAKGEGVMADQFKLYIYNKFAAPANDAAKYALYRTNF